MKKCVSVILFVFALTPFLTNAQEVNDIYKPITETVSLESNFQNNNSGSSEHSVNTLSATTYQNTIQSPTQVEIKELLDQQASGVSTCSNKISFCYLKSLFIESKNYTKEFLNKSWNYIQSNTGINLSTEGIGLKYNQVTDYLVNHPWLPFQASLAIIAFIAIGYGFNTRLRTSIFKVSAAKGLSGVIGGYGAIAKSFHSEIIKPVTKAISKFLTLPKITTFVSRINKLSKTLRSTADEAVKWIDSKSVKTILKTLGIGALAGGIALGAAATTPKSNSAKQVKASASKSTSSKSVAKTPAKVSTSDALKKPTDPAAPKASAVTKVPATVKTALLTTPADKIKTAAAKAVTQPKQSSAGSTKATTTKATTKATTPSKAATVKTTQVKAPAVSTKKAASSTKASTSKPSTAKTTLPTVGFSSKSQSSSIYRWLWITIAAVLLGYAFYQIYLKIKLYNLNNDQEQ